MLFNTESFITLPLVERFRRSHQAAKRRAWWVAVVLGTSLFSPAYAYAPIHDQIQIKQTPQAYAKANLSLDEYNCINTLYYYESRWNYRAYNKSSGAAGIPQGKSVWLRNASPIEQVKWGIAYNLSRYNSMCNALHHFNTKGWH